MVDSLSNEIDKMNLTGSDADNNHKGCFTYTNVFSSPWSPDYWSELKHKSVLQVKKYSPKILKQSHTNLNSRNSKIGFVRMTSLTVFS